MYSLIIEFVFLFVFVSLLDCVIELRCSIKVGRTYKYSSFRLAQQGHSYNVVFVCRSAASLVGNAELPVLFRNEVDTAFDGDPHLHGMVYPYGCLQNAEDACEDHP